MKAEVEKKGLRIRDEGMLMPNETNGNTCFKRLGLYRNHFEHQMWMWLLTIVRLYRA